MIFGKSTEEIMKAKSEKVNDILNNGLRHYAFLPTKMSDGRYIFLEYYRSYIVGSDYRHSAELTYGWMMRRKHFRKLRKDFEFENYSEQEVLLNRLKHERKKWNFTHRSV